jgi:uncharacterized surface protein with fasciclin (FAS1) repeats
MRKLLSIGVALALLAACGDGESDSASTRSSATDRPTVYEILQGEERFATFFGLVQDHGPDILSLMRVDSWDHTMLVPVNEAFDALPDGTLDPYTASEAAFREFFDSHFVGGTIPAVELPDTPQPAAGLIEVRVEGNTVTWGRATIIEADIEARNGMVHAIDTVLFPDDYAP